MAETKELDIRATRKHFAAPCFNSAWDLIAKTDRSPEEDRQMLLLNQASLWHWTQRDDCTPRNLSVGYWQTARIYALLEEGDNARRYGELSLEYSKGEPPFYVGFAYEALARAERMAGNGTRMREYIAKARESAEAVTDPDEKKYLLTDIDSIT